MVDVCVYRLSQFRLVSFVVKSTHLPLIFKLHTLPSRVVVVVTALIVNHFYLVFQQSHRFYLLLQLILPQNHVLTLTLSQLSDQNISYFRFSVQLHHIFVNQCWVIVLPTQKWTHFVTLIKVIGFLPKSLFWGQTMLNLLIINHGWNLHNVSNGLFWHFKQLVCFLSESFKLIIHLHTYGFYFYDKIRLFIIQF